MKYSLEGKKILIIGGTGSLGKNLLRRLLKDKLPDMIRIFSRDEEKQWRMKNEFAASRIIDYHIGDVRSKEDLRKAIDDIDVVFLAAALKQVPTCEDFPKQAILTNICGAQNLTEVLTEKTNLVELVVGVSTDKSVAPLNLYGMTKAIMEKILLDANKHSFARYLLVRYGNVTNSRGSVIPYFEDLVKSGKTELPVTSIDMTRFLITLDKAVNLIYDACENGEKGDTFVPVLKSCSVIDLAELMFEHYKVEGKIKEVGIRPGEKIHEILLNEDEIRRTCFDGKNYVIRPIFSNQVGNVDIKRYSSEDHVMLRGELRKYLKDNGVLK